MFVFIVIRKMLADFASFSYLKVYLRSKNKWKELGHSMEFVLKNFV
jgi:hypothetical protein